MGKISIVIPTFNSEKYIAETLQSVFDQTYQDFEVVVVDDGSTDSTLSVLQTYLPRIKVISKSNGGPASARNLAISNSDGEWIAFLDSDDLWVKNKLELQVAYFKHHPSVGLVYGEALMFRQKNIDRIVERKIGYTEDPTFCKLLYGDFIPNSTVMIRRSCISRIGLLNENKELISVEDYEYWMRMAKEFVIAGLPYPLAYYRIREDSLVGEGKNIDKGLAMALIAVFEIEKRYPDMWKKCDIQRELLIARLYVRAGFAWKNRQEWGKCLRKFAEALECSFSYKVFRWIVAASLLKRWS